MIKQFKLKTKILMTFTVFAVIIGTLIITNMYNTKIITTQLQKSESIQEISLKMLLARIEEKNYFTTAQKNNIFRAKTFIDNAQNELEQTRPSYNENVASQISSDTKIIQTVSDHLKENISIFKIVDTTNHG